MEITTFTICFISGVFGACFITRKILEFKKYEMQEDKIRRWTDD